MPPTPEEASVLVKVRATELGFSLVGVAAADVPLDVEFAHYQDAIARGLHGPIDYVAQNAEVRRRLDTPHVLAGARSVIVVAARYDREDEGDDPPIARSVARYARGRDYHQFLRKRLRRLADFVRGLGEGVAARPIVDTAPVLERAWAARAGVGFVGKNGIVIGPGVGSWLLLGEVVTTLAIAVDAPIEERCGRCTLCLDACPTDAFVAPFVLDAGKCISTLTIELRGAVPGPLRRHSAGHLFGCDVCQEVCPHNARPRGEGPFARQQRPDARWSTLTLETLAQLGMPGEPTLEDLLGGTALRRAGNDGVARNACMALGRSRRADSVPLLRTIAERHPSAVVRDAAGWALDELSPRAQDPADADAADR